MGLLVYVIDDHRLFSEALGSLTTDIQPDADIQYFENSPQTLKALSEETPDLVLIDLNLPDRHGFELMQDIFERAPLCSVVVISASLDSEDMHRALSEGAIGYIPKSSAPEIIQSALQLILAGGVYTPPEMLQLKRIEPANVETNLNTSNNLQPSDSQLDITSRQREVLKLLAEGKSNKQIANTLSCAEGTIKAHIAAIFRALNVSNRTEAVITAKRSGLVEQ